MRIKLLACVALLFSGACHADVWKEREMLDRLSMQMQSLEKLVVAAQETSDPNSRITFDYTALLKDMRAIQGKIDHYLNTPLQPYKQAGVK